MSSRLLGDGMPKVLSGDEFYEKAVKHQKRREEEEKRKELSRAVRQKNAEDSQVFKASLEQRKQLVQARRLAFTQEKKDWEERKARARAEQRPFTEQKPKLGLNLIPKVTPKPRSRYSNLPNIKEGEYFDISAVSTEDELDTSKDSDETATQSAFN